MLPEEKQLRIVNAGFEVFSQSDYKKASTEDIAVAAGISKGLLFYYFHNKKTLYLFLYDYASKLLTERVIDKHFSEITDVFELFEYSAARKYSMLVRNPHITDFIMRAFYTNKEPVTTELNMRYQQQKAEIYGIMAANLDYSKFKEDIDPQEIIRMLTWTADGYIHDMQQQNTEIDFEKLMDKYRLWASIFRKVAYKEEFLT